MLIPKFDIYNTEWLDVVFKNRNQSYGAYQLRKQYAKTLLKAMGITALMLMAVFACISLQSKPAVVAPVTSTEPTVMVDLSKEFTTEKSSFKADAKRHKHNGAALAAPGEQQQQQQTLTSGPAAVPLQRQALAPAAPVITVSTPATTKGPTATPITDEPDLMPVPNGGRFGLNKFLEQNLQYPQYAAKNGISGRVWLSFVVEKDGSLSNIQVTSPAGYGFDEEAVRVLKLAPAWQPGTQNGQLVRVRYSIPVNFSIIR